MKQFKQVLALVMTLFLVFAQCTGVQAKTSAKKQAAKYTISLNKSVYTMKKGKKVTLKATLNKAAKAKGIKWSTSSRKIASVSAKGKVTANKKGSAVITATVKGTKIKASCKIVVGTPVKKITLNKKNISLTQDETFSLKAAVSPKKPSNKKVTYASSNKNVAAVTSKGIIYPVGSGTATITVTAADGAGAKASCTVTVTKVVKNVRLTHTELTIEAGQTAKLSAAVEPSDAADKAVIWSSDNTAAVSVGSNGELTAVAEGTANIKASSVNGKSAVCKVTVKAKKAVPGDGVNDVLLPRGVTLNRNTLTMKTGMQIGLSARIIPENAVNKEIKWTTTDENVAAVGSDGVVTAAGEGTAEITAATVNGKKAVCKVTVDDKENPGDITPGEGDITPGEGDITPGEGDITPGEGEAGDITPDEGDITPGEGDKPEDITPGEGEPGDITPGEGEPGDITPGEGEPGDITPGEGDYGDVTPGEGEPGDITPGEGEPGEAIPEEIALSETMLFLEPGEEKTVTVTITPGEAADQKVTWTTSDEEVAAVEEDGTIRAVGEGTAEITAATINGKSAVCIVTVAKQIGVREVVLSKKIITMDEGDEIKLTASIRPEDASDKTLQWLSSDETVAAVGDNGVVAAVGEGTAEITAVSSNGISSEPCRINVVHYTIMRVSSQAELSLALLDPVITKIIYGSDEPEEVEIPEGDYENKVLEVNAPNAVITNNGCFARVILEAFDTYTENAVNTIEYRAEQGNIIIGPNGDAAIEVAETEEKEVEQRAVFFLARAGKRGLTIVNNGHVSGLHVAEQTDITIEGNDKVPVLIEENAGGTSITASTEVNVTSSAPWEITLLPGAEQSTAEVTERECLPEVYGVGCLPVKVTGDGSNDQVNVQAEMKDSLGIEQEVAVAGSVREITLGEAGGTAAVATKPSSEANVYLIPYTLQNSDMETEYPAYLEGMQASAVTDTDGSYTIAGLTIGNYWIVVKKENFQPVVSSLIITSINSAVYTNGMITLVGDEIVKSADAETISGSESVKGTIIDGLTGKSVETPGLRIKLREGNGNITGTVLLETETDEKGNYSFSNVPAGVYTLEVLDLRQNPADGAVRYNSANKDIIVISGYYSSSGYNCTVDRQMFSASGDAQVQFTLTWAAAGEGVCRDIDSHLVGPAVEGGTFHVSYSNRNYTVEEVKYADLDVDDTSYEGPEHTTIYEKTPGIYHFYVFDYCSNCNGYLKTSSTQVKVTIGTNSYVFNCPNEDGRYWYVCDYNSITHTLIPKNVMSQGTPSF